MANTPRKLRILVPLDRSPGSEVALAAVMPLARRRPVEVTVVHVYPKGASREEAKEYVAKACRGLLLQGVSAGSRVESGDPATEILYLANRKVFDLVAMSTHGRSGVKRLVLGSVTEQVVRHSDIPVVVIRPGVPVKDWGHIVVALDGSLQSERVLDDVAPIAQALGAGIYLLHVQGALHPLENAAPYLHHLSDRFDSLGISCASAVRRGRFAEQIVRFARKTGAGLVAVATGGRTGVRRAVLGSVAEQVFRTAPCAVLVRRKSAAARRVAL